MTIRLVEWSHDPTRDDGCLVVAYGDDEHLSGDPHMCQLDQGHDGQHACECGVLYG